MEPDEKEEIRKMAKELANKLVDPETMKKYGTSFQEGMSRDYVKSLERKYQALYEEFKTIDQDQNGTIGKEELVTFFNGKMLPNGKKCDQKYIDRLFYIMDRNQDARITPKEFIFAYLELEQRLIIKMKKLSLLSNELEDSLKQYTDKKNETQDEKTNSNGVCENASLSITLYEGKELQGFIPNTEPNIFIQFTLEGSKQQSNVEAGNNPIFNEDFTFPITQRNEELEVFVFDQNSFSGTQEVGKFTINLELLENQLKTDNWYFLNGESGTPGASTGSVRLKLRYIYSWKKYYNDLVQKTSEQIKRLSKDIKDMKAYQEALENPFGIIVSGSVNDIIDSRLFEKSEDIVEYINSTRKSVYITGTGSPSYETSAVRFMGVKKEDVSYGNNIKNTFGILSASILLTFAGTGDFVGLIAMIGFLIIFLRNNKSDYDNHLIKVQNGLLVSVGFDVLWIILNIGHLNSRESESLFIAILVFLLRLGNTGGKTYFYLLLKNQIAKFKQSRTNIIKSYSGN